MLHTWHNAKMIHLLQVLCIMEKGIEYCHFI